MKNKYQKMAFAILGKTLLFALLFITVCYGVLTFFADQSSLLENRPALVLGLLAAVLFFSLVFFVFRQICDLNAVSMALKAVIRGAEQPVMLPDELQLLEDDLTHLKEELVRREQEAALSEKKKNELVAYLAHDLKTPLNSVLAYLSMLDTQPEMPEEERIKYTHITLEKALRLEELLLEFFDITRFNLQDFVLETQEMNLSLFLEQIADESYGMLSARGMTCAVDAEEDLMIQGDPDKLARVFDNLLRNAAAYGRENTQILIQARGGRGRTTIVFTNEGEQIPQKKLETIFERFYRVDEARSSQTGGAGLGLAIAKQIVELHGGTITATSDIHNTRFIVTLPDAEEKKKTARRKKMAAYRK